MGAVLKEFLSGPVAAGIQLPGRVVLRRGSMSIGEFRRGAIAGAVTVNGQAVCELEVGGQVIASGKIEQHDDGEWYFVAAAQEEI